MSTLAVSGVFAQATTATLKGKVIGTDGVGLPGVPVTIQSSSHGSAKKTAMTDLQGRFKFRILPPANDYYLSVVYPGFASTDVGPIDLDAGRTTIQDVTLRTSEELTERVEIVAHGSIVDTESTKSSSTFNTEFIEGLPIIGRNYQTILTLTPGVTDTDGDGNPNVQGSRETGLQYRLDGGNITDPFVGTFGQYFNQDAIEEIEVITAGASAEYGRADGGFANIITKSGGNDFEGTFRLIWRDRILDSDGANNNDTFYRAATVEFETRDVNPYLTLGGALKRDKLWYFLSLQYINEITPINLAGVSIDRSQVGWNNFAKLTWQVNPDNKLALQISTDPREYSGGFLGFGIDEDSDALWELSGKTTQLRWASIISPTLLLEALLTNYSKGIGITPVSDLFHTTHIETRVNRQGDQVTLQAVYPTAECSLNGELSGFVENCDASKGPLSIYQIDIVNGTITGPFYHKRDDTRLRNSIKTDLTYTIEDAWGEHQIKTGIEFADEKFEDVPINNPYFINNYVPCKRCRDENGNQIFNAVMGYQFLTVPTPVVMDQRVVSFNSSAYATDTWKPRPNLTIQMGVRIDREDIDTSGFTNFDPRDEKRESIEIVEGLCADGLRTADAGDPLSTADRVCDVATRIPGYPPVDGPLIYTMDDDTPEELRRFDTNDDGVFDSLADGGAWYTPFTAYPDRLPENFGITNLNLSPRFSVSWDPWADGKTKVFSTWGRFHDRLFLSTVDDEMGPDVVSFTFYPDSSRYVFLAGMLSQNASAVSVTQVDRNLKTPYTDVFTVGLERELAPELSARITYTQRKAWDLLQDIDINHIECLGFDDEFGIDPAAICRIGTDSVTGEPILNDDRFGALGFLTFGNDDDVQIIKIPNGAPDLYNISPNFNRVLRIGNFNNSTYRSLTLEINRRLHRNWQMQASYTYSRAKGQAEAFYQLLADDPSTVDDEEGYLAFDQRHRVIVIATTHLPKDVDLGGTISWESGTPWSVVSQTVDQDNVGNSTFRTFYPTHQRNDQRNDGFWTVDAQIVKRFIIGRVQASAQLAVNNLLNDDDATFSAYRVSSYSGVQLVQGPQGLRRFGRYWEVGLTFNF